MDQSASGGIDKGLHISTDPLKAYEWNQDEDTVDVSFTLPPPHKTISKASLRVTISSTKLLVVCLADRGGGGSAAAGDDLVLLDVDLFARVKVGDCTWSRSGDTLEFALEKQQEADWMQLEAV